MLKLCIIFIIFLKKVVPQWHTFSVLLFRCFCPLHRRFSDGWSRLEEPRPPVLIMKTFCIHFHFRRCSVLSTKKGVCPTPFFCMKIYFHYCNISLLRNWSFPHEYFNMYFFEFLLWYCYDIAMTEICLNYARVAIMMKKMKC